MCDAGPLFRRILRDLLGDQGHFPGAQAMRRLVGGGRPKNGSVEA